MWSLNHPPWELLSLLTSGGQKYELCRTCVPCRTGGKASVANTTPCAGSSPPSHPGCRDNLQIRMPTSDRHRYSFARGTVSKRELGSPYPRATVTVKKSWDNSPFDGCSACAVGMQRLWWSWEGGGGREAYDSADNKWALYAAARDSHSCSSRRSLLR